MSSRGGAAVLVITRSQRGWIIGVCLAASLALLLVHVPGGLVALLGAICASFTLLDAEPDDGRRRTDGGWLRPDRTFGCIRDD